ncbi:sulfotransferase family protein [Sulfitobacter alexandrii]|uniref:Sulfotransferase family protein n=1 Tax=Sulfitobacter alexandrii TaxID=1917485 RepID=A0A1J0WLG9_9RHOB|nr:sulfotransferase family protein [Sulfitobacter alexandrii]APE45133.1 sulfotransferase family protein [Sulfitobacter alexandrii]
MRIAMWSGPRNLSTAMMYSFGARADFTVMDEPFYAVYLERTGLDHPMRDEIIAHHERDPQKVAQACTRQGSPHLYMKHMTQHMLPGVPMDWAEGCVHVHLLRHPARVIASYAAKRGALTLEDIGYVQQARLFDQFGGVVIDSHDVRADPEKSLRGLCAAIDLPFDTAMLKWPAGPRAEDGIWASHWYAAVHQSTGFSGAEGPLPELDRDQAALAEKAMPHYEKLWARRLGK